MVWGCFLLLDLDEAAIINGTMNSAPSQDPQGECLTGRVLKLQQDKPNNNQQAVNAFEMLWHDVHTWKKKTMTNVAEIKQL